MTLKLNDSDRQEVGRLYRSGISSYALGKRFRMTPEGIRWNLRRLGIKSQRIGARGYRVNHDFFESIHDEQTSYWLGFITADGHVHVVPGKGAYWMKVVLQKGDAEHLRKFKRTLGADQPVRIRNDGQAHFQVHSKKLCCDLQKHGIAQRKSCFEIVSPSVQEHLLRHFFRGFVDGDGGWFVSTDYYRSGRIKRKAPIRSFVLSIVGGKHILRGFSKWASHTVGTNKRRIRPHAGTWTIRYKGNLQCKALARELYRDATVFLDRKKALAYKLLHGEI
jgi:hypothetical protein